MDSPQLENGYTQIANELMEAFGRSRIPGEARQVLDVILRKTYGYRKKSDWISLSQFVQLTGMRQAHVCRAVNKLLGMKIIERKQKKNGSNYSLNKDYGEWTVPNKGVPKKIIRGVPKLVIRGVPNKGHTKETITKERFTKETMAPKSRKIEKTLSAEMYNEIYRVIDSFEPVNVHWDTLHESTKQYDAAMRMLRIHGIDAVLAQVKRLPVSNKIKFFPRIYTPVQLEEKWESLQNATDEATGKVIEIKKSKARNFV